MAGMETGATVAIDAMGGDRGPEEVIEAVSLALEAVPQAREMVLVGDKARLENLLRAKGLNGHKRIGLHHASEVIGMDEKAIPSIKQKKDSSMVRAVELVRDGRAQVALSCGNTGALVAAGTLILRRMPGIERAALGSIIPSRNHQFLLIDAGANPDPTPERLVQHAILGSGYLKAVLNLERPRVGLLTIGTEEGKGNDKATRTHELLKRCGDLVNYVGPIEGFQIFRDTVDVCLIDGFAGNVLLKGLESAFFMMKDFLKDELKANPLRMTGAFLARGAFNSLKQSLDPTPYAGAPLLGVRGLVVKAHGSSNRAYIQNAIRIACDAFGHDLEARCQRDIEAANRVLREPVATPEPAARSA